MNKILVVAAHPDDEILGLGGTVRRYADNGFEVDCVILGEGMTSRREKREDTDSGLLEGLKSDTLKAAEIIGFKKVYFSDLPDNRFDSLDLLDVVKKVEAYVDKIKPDIIYTHFYGDLNVDHRITFEAVITACRLIGDYCVKEIYCFETPSSTEWSFGASRPQFKPNVFIDIEKTLDSKLKAMSCYRSELKEYPHPRSLKALEIIASRWGSVIGRKYAEAFELVRKVD